MKSKKEKNNELKIPKSKEMIRFYIAISLFIILAILTKTNIIKPLDDAIESFVIGIRNDKLTNIMIYITNISRAYFLISISIILLFILKNKKNALLIIINLTCVFLTSQIFKYIFRRTRPDGEHLISAFGYSFPSGHAMVSLAYFSFILYLINKKVKKKINRIILTILTYVLVLLIGFSRIYLGVHYTSDILAGFLLSIAYMMIFLSIINKNEVKAWKLSE